jgi:hypothetical protein
VRKPLLFVVARRRALLEMREGVLVSSLLGDQQGKGHHDMTQRAHQ